MHARLHLKMMSKVWRGHSSQWDVVIYLVEVIVFRKAWKFCSAFLAWLLFLRSLPHRAYPLYRSTTLRHNARKMSTFFWIWAREAGSPGDFTAKCLWWCQSSNKFCEWIYKFYFYVGFLGGKLLSETSSIAVEFNWSVQTYVSIFVKFVLLGP